MPSETGRILIELFVAYAAARSAGEIATRLRQPAVVGEVLAGVLLGPSLLGWIRPDITLETVATLGAIILLFQAGLETRVSDFARVGRVAVLVALGGVLVPLVGGYLLLASLGYSAAASLFGGAALVATSVGVTARVLQDTGLSTTREARIVLAAAIIDDVLGLLVLAVVAGIGRGSVSILHVGLVALEAAAFVAFQLFVAPRLITHGARYVERLRIADAPLSVALTILLGLAALAEASGLASIVGAFFAGMMFAETADRWSLEERTRPLYGFLVPFFFVLAGVRVDIRVLAQPAIIWQGLGLVAVAIVAKVVGCGFGAISEGWRPALAVGFGMVPRGEVGLIVASLGLSLGVVTGPLYAMVLLVTLVTTIVAPPFLPRLFRNARFSPEV